MEGVKVSESVPSVWAYIQSVEDAAIFTAFPLSRPALLL